MLFRFRQQDLLYNTIKAHPILKVSIYDQKIYFDNKPLESGAFVGSVPAPQGKRSLYEMNVDRDSSNLIYPFITKNGSLLSFRTVNKGNFNNNFAYGDTITGSYPTLAELTIDYYAANSSRPKITALRNTLEHYLPLSRHYEYDNTASFGYKSTQAVKLIGIPSIFYGSSIKKGSVILDFYVTGSLIGRLQDVNRNGELIQVKPLGSVNSGSVAGVVLYNEGFIFLTGSWDVSEGTHTEPYVVGDAAQSPKWVHFAASGTVGGSDDDTWGDAVWGEASYSVAYNIASSSFAMTFRGVQYIPTITMMAHAPRGELNWSNNPTFVQHGQDTIKTPLTSSKSYRQNKEIAIKNIVKTDYNDPTGSFEKVTYITKVGIYDEDKNLIGIAKLAKPLRKRDIDQYTIKMKVDV